MSTASRSMSAASPPSRSVPAEPCWSGRPPARGVTFPPGRIALTMRRRASALSGSMVGDDGAIGGADDLVNEWRRRLAAYEVLAHDGDGKLGDQKLRETHFLAAL